MKTAKFEDFENPIIKILFFCEVQNWKNKHGHIVPFKGLTLEDFYTLTGSEDLSQKVMIRDYLYDAIHTVNAVHTSEYHEKDKFTIDRGYNTSMRDLIKDHVSKILPSKLKGDPIKFDKLASILLSQLQMTSRSKSKVAWEVMGRARHKMYGILKGCGVHFSTNNQWVSSEPLPPDFVVDETALVDKSKGEGTLKEIMESVGITDYQNQSVNKSSYPVNPYIISQTERGQIENTALCNMEYSRRMRYEWIKEITSRLNRLFHSEKSYFETDHARTICEYGEAAINPDNLQILNSHLNRRKGSKSTKRMTFEEQAKHIRDVVKDFEKDINLVCNVPEYVEYCIGVLKGLYHTPKV